MTNSGGKKKILIVDDEPNVVTYLETLLEDNGYETITAMDGVEGLEKARAEKPDLISLDITMPKKSGVGLYRALRSEDELKSIPIVIVTATTGYGGDPEAVRKFISSRKKVPPPDGYVPKPIEQEELLTVIADCLKEH